MEGKRKELLLVVLFAQTLTANKRRLLHEADYLHLCDQVSAEEEEEDATEDNSNDIEALSGLEARFSNLSIFKLDIRGVLGTLKFKLFSIHSEGLRVILSLVDCTIVLESDPHVVRS